MTRKRDHISLETKLASALLALGHIPYDDAKLMTPDQIISLYHFDHNILHSQEGGDQFWNLAPLGIMQHRKKTAEIDVPQAAKSKRMIANEAIRKAAEASKAGRYDEAARILAAAPKPKRPKKKIPSRPFQRGHRPLRSRSSFERRVP